VGGAGPCQGGRPVCRAQIAARAQRPDLRGCFAAATVARSAAGGTTRFMGGFLVPVIEVIIYLLHIYWWIIIISAVMSWLIAFNVINTHSRPVAMIGDFLYRATEPALRPIRHFLPNLGGLDISPIILLLILWFIERELIQLALVVSQY
jgi:YggT family protein